MDKTLVQRMYAGVYAGNVEEVRQLLADHPDLLKMEIVGQTWLHHAACRDHVAMVEMLVDAGLDVNTPSSDNNPEGALSDAARNGCIEVARWLLAHGAKVNTGGGEHWTPLTSAVVSGSLEMVRLLVDHGAALHVTVGTPPENALSLAVKRGHEEIVRLLRSRGSFEPGSKSDVAAVSLRDEILQHVKKHLGPVKELSLLEIVAGPVSVAIHVVPPTHGRKYITLVTTGMSERPMAAPIEQEEDRYAELVMHLPPNWPLTKTAFQDENNYWPVEWLRILAHYPHENNTWISEGHVISNGEPPEPFVPSTGLACFLLLQEPTEFGHLITKAGKIVKFYEVFPLYKEERDLQQAKGTAYLLELFQKYHIGKTVDMNRTNVAQTRIA